MTTEEVINELNTLVKPYMGVIPQSTYSRTLRDIKNGNCKPKTMSKFFALFGYEMLFVKWHKVDKIDIDKPRKIVSVTEDEKGIYFTSKEI